LIRGIFFDLDGTLIDSFQAITAALNLTRASYGLQPVSVEEAKRHVGGGVERLLLGSMGEKYVEEAVVVFRKHYSGLHLEETRLYPGVKNTLEGLLNKQYGLGVATNKPLRFSRDILDHLGILNYFLDVLAPEMVQHRKPHREMLDLLMEKAGITAEETLYIGDMTIDITFARNAGVHVWVLPWGCSTREELANAKPDAILKDFSEITERLGRG